MQVSEKVERLLGRYGAKRSAEGAALARQLLTEATWKMGEIIGGPDGTVLTIRCETRPLTAEEEELLREVAP